MPKSPSALFFGRLLAFGITLLLAVPFTFVKTVARAVSQCFSLPYSYFALQNDTLIFHSSLLSSGVQWPLFKFTDFV